MFLLNSRQRACAAARPTCVGLASFIANVQLLFCRVPSRRFFRSPWYSYTNPPVLVCGTDDCIGNCTTLFREPSPIHRGLTLRSHSPALLRRRFTEVKLSVRICHDTSTTGNAQNKPYVLVNFDDSSRLTNYTAGAGILACCPSTTPFGLALGPTNPGMIDIAQETSGFR